ncbi:MAG: hypothetical protein K0B06_02950 [Brevefilum sp.]|nr:hypothetical protein [Brevefilum sp.]
MMEEAYEFPRSVKMEKAGISYVEEGPNVIFMNVVLKDEEIKLILTIDQTDLGNAFSAMTYGKVITSMPLLEALEMAKGLEDQEEEEDG